MLVLLLFAFLAGIFTVFSPCILPILPAILSSSTIQGKLRPLGVIIGLIVSFTFFTLSLTALVHTTGISANAFRSIAIALIFLFGLIMMFPRLSEWFAIASSPFANLGLRIQGQGSGFFGGCVFGVALGLLWTPCAGPILAAITTLIATQSITFETALIALTYSIGAGIPMFFIAYGGSKIIQSSRFLSQHAVGLRQSFGALMILMALSIALHWDMLLQQQISRFFPSILVEDNDLVKQELQKLGNETSIEENPLLQKKMNPDEIGDFGKAPEITGITNWINSPPISLMQLQMEGKVVLLDFWTYSCINCLRTLPYIQEWYNTYKDDGLVVIGIHTPEFEFEKSAQNVSKAAARLGLTYPIAQDNDYKTWKAYHNQYWPAHYLIDKKGVIRAVHFGEGSYLETENIIRTLLGLAPLPSKEAAPKQLNRPISPEIYLGTLRADHYTTEITVIPNDTIRYSYDKPLDDDTIGLQGKWKAEKQYILSKSNESYLNANFLAQKVYLVLSGSSTTPLQVYLDGHLSGEIIVDGDRKYDIVSSSYGRHQLSLKVPMGVNAYAFTFGDE